MPDVTPTPQGHDAHQSVSRSFLSLGAGEAAARLFAFAVTAYATRVLGAEGFGVVAFATAAVLYLSRIVDAGIDFGLGVHEVAANPERLPVTVPSILTLRLSLAIACIGLFGMGAWAVLPSPEGGMVALYSLTLIPLALGTRWVLIGYQRAAPVAVVRAAGELLALVIVLLTVHGVADAHRMPLAQLAGDTLACVGFAWLLRTVGLRFGMGWAGSEVRRLLRRALPLVGSTVLGLVVFNVDVFFIRLYHNAELVGLYAAAYTAISFILNLGVTYSMSLLPSLTRLASAPERERALYLASYGKVFALALPIAAGGSALARPLMVTMFGAPFASAGPVLAVLLGSMVVSVVRDVSVVALMARRREDLLLHTVWVSAAASVVLNILLVPSLGMMGAALATVLTEGVRGVLAVTFARRLGFPLPPMVRAWRPVVASLAMVAVLSVLPTSSPWLAVPAGGAAYALALALVGGLRVGRGHGVQLVV
ncbi:MAG: oligosaccharide flippase family protein [Gemmatimonadaceae bacterium]|nr:oligosaccharide flippase family protein [Gemmatimonadaceae bacterium]